MNWYKRIKIAGRSFTDIEFLEALAPFGVYLSRKGSGSKGMVTNKYNGKKATFHSGHAGETYTEGIVGAMLKQLGINKNLFFNYLKTRKKQKKRILEQYTSQFAPKEEEEQEQKRKYEWKNQPWAQEQQKYKDIGDLEVAKSEKDIKIAQNIPISIISYSDETGELGISFNSGKKYIYPNVSPFVFDKIEKLLKIKNYKEVQKMLKNLSDNQPDTEEDKQQMLNQLYEEGYLR